MKEMSSFFAILLPIVASVLLGWRFCRHDKSSWQLAACFSALVIITSILLLTVADRISFVRYGDAVVQVNEKLNETRELTEQNKRIAIKTVGLVISSLSQTMVTENYDPIPVKKELSALLQEAGLSQSEIDGIVGKTNAWGFPTNSLEILQNESHP